MDECEHLVAVCSVCGVSRQTELRYEGYILALDRIKKMVYRIGNNACHPSQGLSNEIRHILENIDKMME